ncbi:MAG TPA: O-antigen ligase family protein [Bacteroidales bacterium]|nr:O-antigen ligase family protein [Bacteroidales bacterium]
MNLIHSMGKQENESVHQYIYFICLLILALFLPVSRNMLSIAQIVIAANWLWEGQFREKYSRLKENRHALYLMLVFLVFSLGMLWTSNPMATLYVSLVDKVPFLSLTLVVATSRPLAKERIFSLLSVFGFAVLFTSLIGFVRSAIEPNPLLSNLSPFIHHIRFSVQLVMAIFLLPWIAFKMKYTGIVRSIFFLSALLMLALMIYTGRLTALFSFAAAVGFLLIREMVIPKGKTIRKILAGTILLVSTAFVVGILVYTARPVFKKAPIPVITGEERTRDGNPYWHDFENLSRENGHLVFWFIAHEELRQAWKERSSMNFGEPDNIGNTPLEGGIIRYLTSRGLPKDREGLEALQDYEIRAIENGVPNYLHNRWPTLIIRIHQTFWEIQEYKRTGNPEGFSFAQRIELWKAALAAISEKPVLGWGKGGVHHAVNFGLDNINSQWQLRNIKPHNQYLLYLITLGVAGFVVVAFLMGSFIIRSGATRFLPFNLMLVILFSAMLGEDLLDFQEPITFFLFFAVIFGIILRKQEAPDALNKS